jgi:hypothetical protein
VAEATDLSISMEQTLVNASKILTSQLEILECQAPRKHIKSNEHKEIQLVDDDPSKTALLDRALLRFLRDNISVFTWKPANMPGVPRHLIEQSLNVSKTTRPIKQKLRWFARDKKEAIRAKNT